MVIFHVHVNTQIMYKHPLPSSSGIESRRDQEEGSELDSQEQASPEEIKSREVVLGWRDGLLLLVVSQQRSYGHCLCDSVLHSS